MSAAESKIYIVGLGSDGLAGLTSTEREILNRAELVFGSEETLALVPELQAERLRLDPDLPKVVETLQQHMGEKRMVLLVGGDPLFYGLARYLCDKLGKDHFEVLPHVSSMQLAFARVKESWEEAFLTNLQTHTLDSILERIRVSDVVGIFTSEEEGPHEIARLLLSRGLDYFRIYICENLGAPDERVTQGELEEILEMDFASLNIVILKRKPGRPDLPGGRDKWRRFGNPDDVFAQSKPKNGLITSAEVRTLGLSQLCLNPGSVVWDIGAGSGSVGIEAARLAEPGMVYAIEQDAADYHLIVANAQMMGVRNIKAIHGIAPAVFAGLPAPDAVFIGAHGRESEHMLDSAWEKLRPNGNLVILLATLERVHTIYEHLKRLADEVDVLLVQFSRGVEQLEMLRFEAVNPTFLLHVHKKA